MLFNVPPLAIAVRKSTRSLKRPDYLGDYVICQELTCIDHFTIMIAIEDTRPVI